MKVELVDGSIGTMKRSDWEDEYDSLLFIGDDGEKRCVYKNEVETVL